ncbi:TetR/AcrR family transcriptional regulator [Oceaniglobus trochenteri]|uniref:TetR/AcrR family transcriptional regulator n=1 Tax=Oceaniglobus trochenteri TaxID=2763260 RepID=UPI001CFFC4EC|nr:TetR/AcrR family transcriptional regulator [Oceaniglobus trochenteri]
MGKLEKIDKLESKARKRSEKRSKRKDELGTAAINALKQLGYARTSLRDIAELSGVAVGMLHYYFDDKTDLIKFCVRKYKADFIAELDAVMNDRTGGQPLAEAFAQGLRESIRREAETHRLWYDIRSQALFDPDFADVVEEIEAELIALVSRLFARLGLPRDLALDAYLGLDGAFRYYLHRHLADDADALDHFHAHVLRQLTAIATLTGTPPARA